MLRLGHFSSRGQCLGKHLEAVYTSLHNTKKKYYCHDIERIVSYLPSHGTVGLHIKHSRYVTRYDRRPATYRVQRARKTLQRRHCTTASHIASLDRITDRPRVERREWNPTCPSKYSTAPHDRTCKSHTVVTHPSLGQRRVVLSSPQEDRGVHRAPRTCTCNSNTEAN